VPPASEVANRPFQELGRQFCTALPRQGRKPCRVRVRVRVYGLGMTVRVRVKVKVKG
jgi:hypothetical protein